MGDMADKILSRFRGDGADDTGATGKADGDSADEGAEEKDSDSGGDYGKAALAAIKHGDAEAFCEAIRAIKGE